MYCPVKDDLYRNLTSINYKDDPSLFVMYVRTVDEIKKHDDSGHHGQPCPDAGF